MKKTKKALASLAIAGMVLSMAPMSVFGATDSNRISGAGRVETAIAIAAEGWTTADNVIVVPADDANMVDALAAAPLAGQLNAPILVTYKGALDAKVQQKIVDLKAKNVYAIGALSAEATASLKAIAGVTVTELKGADRTETATKVAAKLSDVKGTFVVAYDGKADALSAASYAAANGYSIVIANPDGTVPAGATVKAPTYTVGGQVTVAGATALKGADRYATNNAVLDGLTFSYDKVYVANGQSLVDALAGAPLAAKTKSPIVLADAIGVATAANNDLTASSKVVALGGTGAVSDTVLGKVAYQAPVVTTLTVESVTALNGKQIQVKFSKAVDETAAETGANYKIYDKAGNTVSLVGAVADAAVLKSDDQTVVLTLASAITTKSDLTVVVTKAIFADADNSEYAPLYSKVVTVDDKTAPTVTKVTSETNEDSTDSVTIEFDEPVFSAAIKIDGKAVSSPTWSKNNTKVVVTTADDLDVAISHKLEVVNATDYCDNVSTLISKTFSITKDTVAPMVTSVTQYSDQKVLVKFDKDMDAATVTALNNIKAVDSSLNSYATSVAKENADTKTDFVVTLSGVSYSDDDTTETFTLSFSDAITDDLGNEIDPVTKQITLTEDTTAPAVESTKVVKDAAGKTVRLEVKFNESISATDINDLTVVDKNGVAVTSDLLPSDAVNNPTFVVGGIDGKTVKLNLSPAAYKLVDKYTFTFKKGFASDGSVGTNDSAAYTATIDFGAADAEEFELTGTPVTTGGNNIFVVNFGRQVKGGDAAGSATNIARYTVNGSSLAEGTTITLNTARTTATITMPSSSVTSSDGSAIFTIIGVQDLDDNVITPYTTTVAVVDNKKPVLQSASLYSYDNVGATPYEASFILTFDEDMSIVDGTDVSDELAIKVGGDSKAIATAQAYAVVGKAKQIRVDFTFATALNTDKTITVKTLDGNGGLNDASALNNEAKADVTVTVAK